MVKTLNEASSYEEATNAGSLHDFSSKSNLKPPEILDTSPLPKSIKDIKYAFVQVYTFRKERESDTNDYSVTTNEVKSIVQLSVMRPT